MRLFVSCQMHVVFGPAERRRVNTPDEAERTLRQRATFSILSLFWGLALLNLFRSVETLVYCLSSLGLEP